MSLLKVKFNCLHRVESKELALLSFERAIDPVRVLSVTRSIRAESLDWAGRSRDLLPNSLVRDVDSVRAGSKDRAGNLMGSRLFDLVEDLTSRAGSDDRAKSEDWAGSEDRAEIPSPIKGVGEVLECRAGSEDRAGRDL